MVYGILYMVYCIWYIVHGIWYVCRVFLHMTCHGSSKDMDHCLRRKDVSITNRFFNIAPAQDNDTWMDGPMHEILTFIAYALKSVLKVEDV